MNAMYLFLFTEKESLLLEDLVEKASWSVNNQLIPNVLCDYCYKSELYIRVQSKAELLGALKHNPKTKSLFSLSVSRVTVNCPCGDDISR